MKSFELYFVLFTTTIVALSNVVVVVFAQFDQFGGGGPQPCPAFSCPRKDEVPVSKWPLKLSSVGCHSLSGASGGLNMMQFSAPSPADQVIAPCCDAYNACLQICGLSNVYCARAAETCFDATCEALKNNGNNNNSELHDACTKDIVMKKLMVSFGSSGGCGSFAEGQKQNCRCVPKVNVVAQRTKTLRGFYKKFNPDQVDKVDALLAKATDAKKFAGLLYKLVVKYPKAIKKVIDPQQQMMEELMRNGGKDFAAKSEKASSGDEVVYEEEEEEETDSDERIEL